MIYSKTCEYALRALCYLTTKPVSEFTMIPEVNRETGVPGPYLAKIFQCLVRSEVLKSRRGPTGGFAFNRSPKTVSLLDIVKAVDDISILADQCVMGLDNCSSENACPLHVIWEKAKERIVQKLNDTSMTEMKKKVGKLPYRKMTRARLNGSLQLSAT